MDDVVRNSRFRQQHVQLPGHAARHGVHRELHLLHVKSDMFLHKRGETI